MYIRLTVMGKNTCCQNLSHVSGGGKAKRIFLELRTLAVVFKNDLAR